MNRCQSEKPPQIFARLPSIDWNQNVKLSGNLQSEFCMQAIKRMFWTWFYCVHVPYISWGIMWAIRLRWLLPQIKNRPSWKTSSSHDHGVITARFLLFFSWNYDNKNEYNCRYGLWKMLGRIFVSSSVNAILNVRTLRKTLHFFQSFRADWI